MKHFTYGHGIVLALSAFVLLMAWFMVRAIHNQEELVTNDYYAQELRYQDRIDQLERTAALGSVAVDAHPGLLTITLPSNLLGAQVTGELYLMRPNDARFDHRQTVRADGEGRIVVDTRQLARGAYAMQLDWTANGEDYFTEQRLYLP